MLREWLRKWLGSVEPAPSGMSVEQFAARLAFALEAEAERFDCPARPGQLAKSIRDAAKS